MSITFLPGFDDQLGLRVIQWVHWVTFVRNVNFHLMLIYLPWIAVNAITLVRAENVHVLLETILARRQQSALLILQRNNWSKQDVPLME